MVKKQRVTKPDPIRNLVIIVGDQLDCNSAAFDGFDPALDAVWMSETPHETTHVWCHKLRIAYFFSAMRHFREEATSLGLNVHYRQLEADPARDEGKTFNELLLIDARRLKPQKLIVLQPGDYRVAAELQLAARTLGLSIEVRDDRHFYCTPDQFADFAKGKKSLVMENFYRLMRKTHQILMTPDGEPEGGAWNFDEDNRQSFPKTGPGPITGPLAFETDSITRDVLQLVATRFKQHPGELTNFNLPVTKAQARQMLTHFVKHSLSQFGPYEDAMWTDQPFLYHSRLSAALNLHLLDPRECIAAAEKAYRQGKAPLASVEGFIRQIVGWREFIRGIYWLKMPEYMDLNYFQNTSPLPHFYWDGHTEMQCVKHSMQNVLEHGYAHHIQRLMVLGNLAQTFGASPQAFHEWHMAMYLDAIDWVSLPNTLGMSQYGDGGIVGTKPYCATGNYVQRMSNYCKGCRYNYKESVGESACPLTTFYWDFLARNRDKLIGNTRMIMQLKNVDRKSPEELNAIAAKASELRQAWVKADTPATE